MPSYARIMSLLLSDPTVRAIPVLDCRQPLVELPFGGPAQGVGRLARSGLADRLADASELLPVGLRFHLSEGYRPQKRQEQIIADYALALRRSYPELDGTELEVLQSRYVAPLDVAPHVCGAAVDITLADGDGPMWMGSELDATPEESGGRCYTAAANIDAEGASNRKLLCTALEAVGFVNYPSEWWHWSYGDRYWAVNTGASHAIYGPTTPNESE